MNGELGVVRSLNGFIDNSIDDTKGVELELNSLDRTIGNLLVFFIEMVEELLTLGQVEATSGSYLLPGHSVWKALVVDEKAESKYLPAIAFSPEVELLGFDL